jgi:FAD synthetase
MNEIFLSFNGGKDCTVLLDIIHEILGESINELKIFYFRSLDPFPEIEEFVKSCENYYKIKIIEIQADTSMKQVLTDICENHKEIRACIMGSRRSDPWCDKLQDFQVGQT